MAKSGTSKILVHFAMAKRYTTYRQMDTDVHVFMFVVGKDSSLPKAVQIDPHIQKSVNRSLGASLLLSIFGLQGQKKGKTLVGEL